MALLYRLSGGLRPARNPLTPSLAGPQPRLQAPVARSRARSRWPERTAVIVAQKTNGRHLSSAVRRLLGGRSLATTPGGVCHACTSRPRPYGCARQSIELRNSAAGCRAGRGRLKPMFGAAYERRCLQISMPPAVERARRHGRSHRFSGCSACSLSASPRLSGTTPSRGRPGSSPGRARSLWRRARRR